MRPKKRKLHELMYTYIQYIAKTGTILYIRLASGQVRLFILYSK